MLKINSFGQEGSIESNNSHVRQLYHTIIRQNTHVYVVVVGAGLTTGVALSP